MNYTHSSLYEKLVKKQVKMKDIIDTSEFETWLNDFIDYSRNQNKNIENLKKMEYFASLFDNPQENYNSIHIAGSKGKGSVSTMLSFILKEADLKSGLYTSPHVMDFRERISLAGTFFSDEEYSNTYEKIIKLFERISKENPELDPGWFEIVTMTAFLLFSLEKCDWAVLETGMGGRLDMTNIVHPQLCILTPIELEHCAYLGDTITKIANEKAGIIKPNIPVFCAKQSDEALKVFKAKAKEQNAEFFYIPEIVKEINSKRNAQALHIDIEFNPNNKIGKLFSRNLSTDLKLLDSVQAENASLAACAVKYLFPGLNEDIIERALAKAYLPARFEIISDNPKIIVDGAHTKKSLELCLKTFSSFIESQAESSRQEGKGILVFACADDKNTRDFAHLFKNLFKKIIITIPTEAKASDIDSTYNDFKAILIDNTAGNILELEKNRDYKNAIKAAREECKRENIPLLITGSFYLAAVAKKIL